MNSQARFIGRRGFSLIELLLITAMLLVLGVMATPFYGRFFTQSAVSNTTDKFIQNIRKAQTYSMTSRKSINSGWGVYYTGQTLTLYQGSSYAARAQTWDETYTVEDSVTVTSGGNGTFEINFARLTGLPIPTSATILITGNQGTSETITLNSQGMVTR